MRSVTGVSLILRVPGEFQVKRHMHRKPLDRLAAATLEAGAAKRERIANWIAAGSLLLAAVASIAAAA